MKAAAGRLADGRRTDPRTDEAVRNSRAHRAISGTLSPMESRWFAAGLRFGCTGCGACCGGSPGYVWVNEEEILALARRLGLSPDGFGRTYLRRVGTRLSLIERADGDCVFFDRGRGCRVYDARPVQCRTFPFWPEHLRDAGAWRELAARCPGLDAGRLFTEEEIARIRRGRDDAARE